jgi:hypothetical protein
MVHCRALLFCRRPIAGRCTLDYQHHRIGLIGRAEDWICWYLTAAVCAQANVRLA